MNWDKISNRLFSLAPTQNKEKEKTHKIDNKHYLFNEIIGYEDIKTILRNTLSSEHSVSILLSGSAGCGKSMFLSDIQKRFPGRSYFIDGSRATKAGIFEVLFKDTENRIRYLIIDELDKLSLNDQESLLTLIQDGKLVQTLKTETRTKSYENISVIAASNDKETLLYPLLTRLFVIPIKDYTENEFKDIAVKILPEKYKISQELAAHIANSVWHQDATTKDTDKNRNIRQCEQIAKLSNNSPQMVDMLLGVMLQK